MILDRIQSITKDLHQLVESIGLDGIDEDDDFKECTPEIEEIKELLKDFCGLLNIELAD